MGHAAPDRAEFHTTRWSVVLSALGPEGEAHAALQGESRTALETLCAAYWYPLYAFARRTGLGHEAAEDAIQSFFARLLEKRDWHADPLRGRFRAFLLGALRNFLAHERERARTLKRGGGEAWVSADDARLRYEREAPLSDSPEHCYERAFALALVDQSLERLQAEQQHAGKAVQFAALRQWLGAAEGAPPYARLAQELQTSEGALRVALHRLRRRAGELMRQAVADLVHEPGDVDGELQALLEALGR